MKRRAFTSGRMLGDPERHEFERNRDLEEVHREREREALTRSHAAVCTDPQAHERKERS